MYIFEEYHYNQLDCLKDDWIKLSKGKDMSIYQSYEWYQMLRSYSLADNHLHTNIFVVCRNKNREALLIAPLWILRHSLWWPFNRKGAYLLGREGSSDYLNIIYNEFYPEALDFVIQQIKVKYKIKNFKFELIREDTSLYSYLLKKNIVRDHRLISVGLELPETYEEYLSTLSKSAKQNLRTANNRIIKDGKSLKFILDDLNVDRNVCIDIKASRIKKKNYEPHWGKRIKRNVYNFFRIKFPEYVPFLTSADTHIMSIYCDGNLAAFFNYGINTNNKNVYIMTAGTNEEFARYSPGILLMNEYIKYAITHKDLIKVIDFTRGDEKYKYVLGGKNHIIHSIRLTI